MSNDDWAVNVCRDRVARAGEIRSEIGKEWERYMADHPRQIDIIRENDDATWVFVVKTITPMPLRLSTLFGEWLYELRAALDGIAFFLAVRDSGQNPPPGERTIYFPVVDAPTNYDAASHRKKLMALSDETFAALRHIQPFNAQPDHRSNVLWWLHELARIDRHRYGHALAPHIKNVRVGFLPPLRLIRHLLPEAAKSFPIDGSTPMRIFEFDAPPDWDVSRVREHIDVTDALDSRLDVTEWAQKSSSLMRRLELGARMSRCELFVLNDIIEPLVAGDITVPQK